MTIELSIDRNGREILSGIDIDVLPETMKEYGLSFEDDDLNIYVDYTDISSTLSDIFNNKADNLSVTCEDDLVHLKAIDNEYWLSFDDELGVKIEVCDHESIIPKFENFEKIYDWLKDLEKNDAIIGYSSFVYYTDEKELIEQQTSLEEIDNESVKQFILQYTEKWAIWCGLSYEVIYSDTLGENIFYILE